MVDNLETLTDEKLCALSKQGNDKAKEILIERYRRLVKMEAHQKTIYGGDNEDVVQEAIIGLWHAIDSYDENNQSNSSFKTYATHCVRNRVVSAVRSGYAEKHRPFKNYVSLSAEADENNVTKIIVSKDCLNPETEYINNETLYELQTNINDALTALEINVLGLYIEGYSYLEIGEKLGRTAKTADNAIQRIRKKLEKEFNGVS